MPTNEANDMPLYTYIQRIAQPSISTQLLCGCDMCKPWNQMEKKLQTDGQTERQICWECENENNTQTSFIVQWKWISSAEYFGGKNNIFETKLNVLMKLVGNFVARGWMNDNNNIKTEREIRASRSWPHQFVAVEDIIILRVQVQLKKFQHKSIMTSLMISGLRFNRVY